MLTPEIRRPEADELSTEANTGQIMWIPAVDQIKTTVRKHCVEGLNVWDRGYNNQMGFRSTG